MLIPNNYTQKQRRKTFLHNCYYHYITVGYQSITDTKAKIIEIRNKTIKWYNFPVKEYVLFVSHTNCQIL